LLYGLPRDLVLGLRFVTPTGEIVSAGGKTVKNVSGFDVCKLMIGSLGTLGLIGEATLRLLPLPERRQTEIFTFDSLNGAARFIDRLFTEPLLPAAVELMNARGYAALETRRDAPVASRGFAVAVALEGIDEAVGRMAAECRKLSTETEALRHETLPAEEHGPFWLQYSGLGARLAERFPAGIALRAGYPIAAFTKVIAGLEAAAEDCGLVLSLWVHAGSGVARAHLPLADEGGDVLQRITAFAARVLEFMRGADGNLVVEQAGVAIKSQLQVWGLPPDSLRVMSAVKRRVDPQDLFSPGRFVGGI
jgi:glycolate oxidase